MAIKAHTHQGFTIVELLIVVVVIAILAAITIVSYNGITNRANDTSVQNDLRNIAKKFEEYRVNNDVYPAGPTQIAALKLQVARKSYGNGFGGGAHNLLYCRVATPNPPKEFALMASSVSGKIFVYRSATGGITTIASWPSSGSSSNCTAPEVNIPQVVSTDRDIFYLNGAWDETYFTP